MIIPSENIKDCFFWEEEIINKQKLLISIFYNVNINNIHDRTYLFYITYKTFNDFKNFVKFKFMLSNYNYIVEENIKKFNMSFYIYTGRNGFNDDYDDDNPFTASSLESTLNEKINLFVDIFYSYYDIHYKVFSVGILKKFSNLVKKV